MALLTRLHRLDRPAVPFRLDGRDVEGRAGDTVLTAVLALSDRLRTADAGDGPRAGFCLIGACQDCWVRDGEGRLLRACSTPLEPGMEILTAAAGAA